MFMFPLSGVLAGFWGWKIYKFILQKRKERLRSTIIKQCQDLITIAAGMYASGKNTADMMQEAAKNLTDPLGSEIEHMVSAHGMLNKQYPDMFRKLKEKYDVPEFGAIAAILELGRTGGATAIGNGFSRLSDAIRRRNRIAAERAKAMAEPSMIAGLFMGILFLGLLVDITYFRDVFAASLIAKITLLLGMGIITGMMYLFKRISKNADLGA
jgi:Flp pilus assembly protein TadB